MYIVVFKRFYFLPVVLLNLEKQTHTISGSHGTTHAASIPNHTPSLGNTSTNNVRGFTFRNS